MGLTMGSLFDGSGGFPLGSIMAGIEPRWASEVEPFPVRVTTKRLPGIRHLGNVCDINGGDIEPVDIITFGSPCQGLSNAGKRYGLYDDTRSCLFFQAVRIVKEMREKTDGKYPRYIVWENVLGAFSSNGGEDFRAVLANIISVKGEVPPLPLPDKGKWPYADVIMGDGFSVAYRVLDAQYWGVPQRRKRIYLVADFDGGRAGKILFESEGLSGYSAEGFRAWQGAAGSLAESTGETGSWGAVVLNDQGGNRMDITEELTSTLRAEAHHPPCVMFENHGKDVRYTGPLDTAPTVCHQYGTGGNNQPFVVNTPKTLKVRCGKDRPGATGGRGPLVQDNLSGTISCFQDQTLFEPKNWDGTDIASTLTRCGADGSGGMPDKGNFSCVVEAYGISSDSSNAMKSSNPKSGIYKAGSSRTLDGNGGSPACNQGGIAVVETYAIQGSMIGREDKNGPQGDGINKEVSFTLNTADRHAVTYCASTGNYMQVEVDKTPTLVARDFKDPHVVARKTASGDEVFGTLSASMGSKLWLGNQEASSGECHIMEAEYSVRRLTPKECARLQGFPDWWCDGLETENPSEDEINFWKKVFNDYAVVTESGAKEKTESRIRKWLEKPYSDSAEYKMWGNGVALPCVWFVMSGIAWADGEERELEELLS